MKSKRFLSGPAALADKMSTRSLPRSSFASMRHIHRQTPRTDTPDTGIPRTASRSKGRPRPHQAPAPGGRAAGRMIGRRPAFSIDRGQWRMPTECKTVFVFHRTEPISSDRTQVRRGRERLDVSRDAPNRTTSSTRTSASKSCMRALSARNAARSITRGAGDGCRGPKPLSRRCARRAAASTTNILPASSLCEVISPASTRRR